MSAEYDLTPRLIPNLDRHLVLPLLDFLDSNSIYPHEQLLRAKYDVLKDTNMVTYLVGLHREIHGGNEDDPAPEEFAKKESEVMSQLDSLKSEAEKVMEVISNPEVVAALRQDKAQNLTYLEKEHDVRLSQLAALYHYGRYQFTIGAYGGAADYLYHFRVLSTDNDLVISSMWGKLASDILEGSFDSALDELHKLKDSLDQRSAYGANPLVSLQQRTWWLHWSLFVYFNHPKGPDSLVDHWLGSGQSYLHTLQTACPYLLRYLVAALIVAKRAGAGALKGPASSRGSREAVRDVIRAVAQEKYQYSDPVTEFLRLLYSEVDFSGARDALLKAKEVFADDFFLSDEETVQGWMENGRTMLSEAYCRVHERVDMKELAGRLGLEGEEGEKWIVRLVRDARLDAKIDFKENTLHMNHHKGSVHQTVIERTKRLISASNEQAYKLQAIAQSQNGGEEGAEGGAAGPAQRGGRGGGRGGRGRGRGRSTIAEVEA